MSPLASCLYEGNVFHRRMSPVEHEFNVSLFMVYLDLDELSRVFAKSRFWSLERPGWAWFRRSDFLGPHKVPLDEAVRDLVAERGFERPSGPIRMLTNLRYFGYSFNPVSFYYCFDPRGERVETVVAEITNTPWRERHAYVLSRSCSANASGLQFRFDKEFHVSPFIDMDCEYDWALNEPADQLRVRMQNSRQRQGFFSVGLTMKRAEIGSGALRRVLFRYPFLTARIIWGIHFQAFRLWLKRCPFYSHPSKREREVPSA